MFNVPHVTSIYLVKKSAFNAISFKHNEFDPDMAMCESLRNAVSFEKYKETILLPWLSRIIYIIILKNKTIFELIVDR